MHKKTTTLISLSHTCLTILSSPVYAHPVHSPHFEGQRKVESTSFGQGPKRGRKKTTLAFFIVLWDVISLFFFLHSWFLLTRIFFRVMQFVNATALDKGNFEKGEAFTNL